jgi:hypothetical protein
MGSAAISATYFAKSRKIWRSFDGGFISKNIIIPFLDSLLKKSFLPGTFNFVRCPMQTLAPAPSARKTQLFCSLLLKMAFISVHPLTLFLKLLGGLKIRKLFYFLGFQSNGSRKPRTYLPMPEVQTPIAIKIG